MNNMICIEPCEFNDVCSKEITKGFRAYDLYTKTYCNFWETIPDNDLAIFVEVIKERETDAQLKMILRQLQENKLGIYIAGNYYEWNEIKDMLPKFI